MELIIVILIIGVIAAIGFSNYARSRENTLDKEAFANLRLIQAAENVYRFESGAVYPRTLANESNIANINQFLKLSLPTAGRWNYRVSGQTSPNPGCAQATRNGDNGRAFVMTLANTGDPQASPPAGACP